MNMQGFALMVVLVATGCAPPAPELERSTPEAEGVSSAGIEAFLDGLAESGIEAHSFMLLRHGKVVAEGWWEPYGPEHPHILFSASKSLTSLGVGMAMAEGRFDIDDRVASFFPEHVTDSVSPAMRELTVRHLLTMSVGQEQDPAFTAMSGDLPWTKVFLHEPPIHEPGSVFLYNNLASFMLSAIVQETTGERLLDYLQPRLFEPLGIESVTWDENPRGITLGMIGASLRTEDMAKLGQLLLQEGEWQGRQLVPAAYVEDAASFHITTNTEGVPDDEVTDAQMGYGYQFWMGRDGSFRMAGLGGQLVIVMPDHDAVAVFTSNVGQNPDQVHLVWEYLVPAMRDEPLPADPAAHETLQARLASLEIAPAPNAGDPAFIDATVEGETFALEENPQGLTGATFAVEDDRCVVNLQRDDGPRTLEAGLASWRTTRLAPASLSGAATDGFGRRAPADAVPEPVTAALTCGLQDDDTLVLTARFVTEGLGAESWTIDFESDGPDPAVAITTGAGRPGAPPPVIRGTAAAEAPAGGNP